MTFKKNIIFASLALLIVLLAPMTCAAGMGAINIPVGSPIYAHLETLESYGLIRTALLSTKPFTYKEVSRLATEARSRWARLDETERTRLKSASVAISKLERELENLLPRIESLSVKPVANPYVKYFYLSKDIPVPPGIARGGDSLREGSNARAGLGLMAGSDYLSFNLSPEYRLSEDSSDFEARSAYIIGSLSGIEAEAGKDPMWWGSSFHGSLIMSDNAEPFESVKITSSRPFLLPWVFKRLGLVKPTVFLARLEEDRDYPRASLLGMRLDLRPAPVFQIGFSRVFMFGGEGRRGLSLSEWGEIFFVSDSADHSDSPINGNQLASIDASIVYLNKIKYLPFASMKLYTEWGFEDSSGDTKTPSGQASLLGVFFKDMAYDGLDLRVEWADTAHNERYGPLWYEHGVYFTGYRYNGREIGHHMGGDARDLFARAEYLFSESTSGGLEFDYERSGVHGESPETSRWIGADVTRSFGDVSVKGIVGVTNGDEGGGALIGIEVSSIF
ncbi:MAG: hypothetical protein HY956_06390 [Deltaproteobacteria bacterium]|nr:hypothetical protein [Deltaproteobacteria bacterium]